MKRLATLVLASVLLAAGPATAQTVGDVDYEQLLRQARALAAIEPTDQESRQLMRATAVTLAERLKRFAIAETEDRDDDKIAAPPVAGLRPGQGEKPDSAAPGADREDVDDIPNPWFARYVTEARGELDALITDLDSGTVAAADLMLKADTVNLLLLDLARPPDAAE